MTIPDEARRAAIEEAMVDLVGGDSDGAHAIYHDDAVLEFPQSGERFEGLANFKEWRELYPSDLQFDVRRIGGSGDVWVRELTVSYDGGSPMLGIAVLEFRGDRVATERIYVTAPWEAPGWDCPRAYRTTRHPVFGAPRRVVVAAPELHQGSRCRP